MRQWENRMAMRVLFTICLAAATAVVPLAAGLSGMISVRAATKKIRLSATKVTLKVGKTKTLKLNGVKKSVKIKWSSSKKKIAAVTSKGKIKAKKAGTCVITAKASGKKYKCKVTVQKKKATGTGEDGSGAGGSGNGSKTGESGSKSGGDGKANADSTGGDAGTGGSGSAGGSGGKAKDDAEQIRKPGTVDCSEYPAAAYLSLGGYMVGEGQYLITLTNASKGSQIQIDDLLTSFFADDGSLVGEGNAVSIDGTSSIAPGESRSFVVNLPYTESSSGRHYKTFERLVVKPTQAKGSGIKAGYTTFDTSKIRITSRKSYRIYGTKHNMPTRQEAITIKNTSKNVLAQVSLLVEFLNGTKVIHYTRAAGYNIPAGGIRVLKANLDPPQSLMVTGCNVKVLYAYGTNQKVTATDDAEAIALNSNLKLVSKKEVGKGQLLCEVKNTGKMPLYLRTLQMVYYFQKSESLSEIAGYGSGFPMNGSRQLEAGETARWVFERPYQLSDEGKQYRTFIDWELEGTFGAVSQAGVQKAYESSNLILSSDAYKTSSNLQNKPQKYWNIHVRNEGKLKLNQANILVEFKKGAEVVNYATASVIGTPPGYTDTVRVGIDFPDSEDVDNIALSTISATYTDEEESNWRAAAEEELQLEELAKKVELSRAQQIGSSQYLAEFVNKSGENLSINRISLNYVIDSSSYAGVGYVGKCIDGKQRFLKPGGTAQFVFDLPHASFSTGKENRAFGSVEAEIVVSRAVEPSGDVVASPPVSLMVRGPEISYDYQNFQYKIWELSVGNGSADDYSELEFLIQFREGDKVIHYDTVSFYDLCAGCFDEANLVLDDPDSTRDVDVVVTPLYCEKYS